MVSNEEMQSLWGRILAGEANEGGSFSRRTLRMVADLDRRDAEHFSRLCQYRWKIAGTAYPLVLDYDGIIYADNGISFDLLNHLDDIGLVTFEPAGGFLHEYAGEEFDVSYFESEFCLIFDKRGERGLTAGHVLFTQPGAELAEICSVCRHDGFEDYILHQWLSAGHGIACKLPA
jgi:hypothetical protein